MSAELDYYSTVVAHLPANPSKNRLAWYAAFTRSNFESRVATELVAKGLEVYFPTVMEKHQWADRKKDVAMPVLPGYVFVRFADSPEGRLKILRTTGTVRIVGHGLTIDPIPDAEIESLQRLVASRKALILYPFLREGTKVRVTRGPLRGVEGRLTRIKNEFRLVVSIELLSQSVATEINTRDVEPVQD